MSRTVIRAGLAALLLFVTAGSLATLAAQDWAGRGRVQGIVSDEEGEPVKGAIVRLFKGGLEGPGPEPLETNARGRWSYLGLGGGSWTVEIEYPGYAISEVSIPVSEFGNNETLLVQLERPAQVAARTGDKEAAAKQAATEAATKTLAEAGALIEAGRFDEGRKLLDEAITQLDPSKHPAVLLEKAKTYFTEGNVDQTVATIQQGLAIDPNHVESLRLISSILVNEGREEEAAQYRARLPAGQKIDPNAFLNQGISLYNSGELEEALSKFDQIVVDYPNLADAYYYRGLVHLGKAQNEQAIADFKKMLELEPGHANAGEAKQFLEYLESQ
ncbi:MAG TPA: tetratricopeptide repeat protein [Thermoanaerobaculia bacterium]|nr:tetratricopeptide repeat protein [Thermoanaerobaculia bacterium]